MHRKEKGVTVYSTAQLTLVNLAKLTLNTDLAKITTSWEDGGIRNEGKKM